MAWHSIKGRMSCRHRATNAPGHTPATELAGYYRHERRDIRILLPANARRILDVGCRQGAILAWLERRYPAAVRLGSRETP
jgi:2-polyprenyl-3-methyl-5-hydroxy-6-metoxy-1,4-benzoquinol methylase